MSHKPSKNTVVLGLMSGTSLDGLDLALCEFSHLVGDYRYKILKAKTLAYSSEWKKRLCEAPGLKAEAYFELHAEYGSFMAKAVNVFLKGVKQRPQLIGSHGHTIFHQPRKGFSTQLGCGATLAAKTGITTVCDFRSLDVALGGQGAPLVPIGDELLFPDFDACLNLGGIANISYRDTRGNRKAFDVCVANMLLNHLSLRAGKDYDAGGKLAAAGKVNLALLKKLNGLDYYRQNGPKSLGREWFEKKLLPLLHKSPLSVQDLMCTSAEHIALLLSKTMRQLALKKVLVTGGGALNVYLLERLDKLSSSSLVIPDKETINYKEALIFAFLGNMRFLQKINTLAGVTAASKDSIGGAIYLGNTHSV